MIDVPQTRRMRPTVILMTCCMSLFVIFMDVTIVNVALPTIRASFGATTAELQWTIDAYTIVVASFLMFAGSMADRFGRRRVFQIGMSLFCLGSTMCGLSTSVHWLIVFRAVQALGGAMLNPVALAIISNTFTQPVERAKAIGVWGAVAGIAMAAGPAAGGLLTNLVGWRSIFWVNVPICLVAIVCAALFIPESQAARPRRIDPIGQMFVMGLLAFLIGAVIEGPRLGWRSIAETLLMIGAAVSFMGIIIYEPRRRDPLVDLKLFRGVPFAGAVAMAVSCFAAFGAILFLTSIILQEVKGYSASQAGLCILPMAAGTIIFAPISARMVGRWGPRPSLMSAGLMIAVSALILSRWQIATPLWQIVAAYTLFGIGFGMVNAPITYTAVSGLPLDRAGVAAAFTSASRQTGTSLGVALAGTMAGAQPMLHERAGSLFIDHSHPMWWLIVSIGAFVAAIGYVSTTAWGVATSRHAAGLFAE